MSSIHNYLKINSPKPRCLNNYRSRRAYDLELIFNHYSKKKNCSTINKLFLHLNSLNKSFSESIQIAEALVNQVDLIKTICRSKNYLAQEQLLDYFQTSILNWVTHPMDESTEKKILGVLNCFFDHLKWFQLSPLSIQQSVLKQHQNYLGHYPLFNLKCFERIMNLILDTFPTSINPCKLQSFIISVIRSKITVVHKSPFIPKLSLPSEPS